MFEKIKKLVNDKKINLEEMDFKDAYLLLKALSEYFSDSRY